MLTINTLNIYSAQYVGNTTKFTRVYRFNKKRDRIRVVYVALARFDSRGAILVGIRVFMSMSIISDQPEASNSFKSHMWTTTTIYKDYCTSTSQLCSSSD